MFESPPPFHYKLQFNTYEILCSNPRRSGLYEGYSDTTCEFFPDKEAALKHIKQHVDTYREDEMCVNIEHDDDHPHPSTYVTMTRNHEDYHNSVTIKSMDHDDWVEENGDEVSVEVFRLIELDNPYRSDTTESVWLTWDQQDCLCGMGLLPPVYVTCSPSVK